MHIHLHHYYHNSLTNEEVSNQLSRIEKQLTKLMTQETILMAMTKAELDRLTAATDQIAARFKALNDRLGDQLTAEEQAQLEKDVAALEAMGKDPANPVPPMSTT